MTAPTEAAPAVALPWAVEAAIGRACAAMKTAGWSDDNPDVDPSDSRHDADLADAASADLRAAIAAAIADARREALAEVDAACERIAEVRDRDGLREGDGGSATVEWAWWHGGPEWFVPCVPATTVGGGYITPHHAILAAAAALDAGEGDDGR